MKIPKGGAGQIPPCEVKCNMDEFENSIRKIGVVAACRWFGHSDDSQFTAEAIKILRSRSRETKVKDAVK